MRLQRFGRVGVFRHIVAIGQAVAKRDMHHRAGERAVRAGPHPQRHVGLAHRLGVVDVDGDDLGAALLSGAGGVGHQVDLRGDRVGAPDDDAIRLLDLVSADAAHLAGPRDEAGPRDADADVAIEAGIALGVGQALDAVAHDEPHRAGIEIGPDAFGAVLALGVEKSLGRAVKRFVPGDRCELA